MNQKLVKIGPKHQITIPKQVFEGLGLAAGDFIKVAMHDGRGLFFPTQLVPKVRIGTLTAKQQRLLTLARQKIDKILVDPIHSKGLTRGEADIAAKAGLIDRDQRWYWLESWQKGEREVDRNFEAGKYEEYATPEEFLASLVK